MTISVWRYSHLALAVSSFLFIALASLTGVILAFEPINEKMDGYRAAHFDTIHVATALPVLKKSYEEIIELKTDANQFVIVNGTDTTGTSANSYVDPSTGKILGLEKKKSAFFNWVTDFHRSLFLHGTGRLFVGITAFLLLLIALSGTMLIIQRQRGVKRFFRKIVKDNFAQYWHVVLGRISLLVILIISVSGTYLSLSRFGIFKEQKISHQIDFDKIKESPKLGITEFPLFKTLLLSEVVSIEYPFSEDVEDYFLIKLHDRELAVNQYTGEILSEIKYVRTATLSELSLDLHTGRKSMVWAVVLGLASINILFFIWSGFAITLKRRRNRTKNKFKPADCRFIILAGSENGSTMGFAKAVQQQLIASGQKAFIADLNQYALFPKAEHILVMTATYGLGDAPTNAKRFASLLEKIPQVQPVKFSVVAFGSKAYPNFCKFGFEVNNILSTQPWATPSVEIHTVNDRSPVEFNQWFDTWSQKAGLAGLTLPSNFYQPPAGLETMSVLSKTSLSHADGAFIIQLETGWRSRFKSGDLLAIYPANDHRERLYSIGRIDKEIQLSVKLHPDGLGSGFLYNLEPGTRLRARIVSNSHFDFPKKASAVVMICNGTGIAPFLGMIDENNKKVDCHLYCGFRTAESFELYKPALKKHLDRQQLNGLHTAYSREGEKQYVKDLLARDAGFIAETLSNNGVLMLCGSLSMQKDVIALLDRICEERTGKGISHFQSHGQVLMDCY